MKKAIGVPMQEDINTKDMPAHYSILKNQAHGQEHIAEMNMMMNLLKQKLK